MPRPSCPAGVYIHVFNDIASFEHRHAHRFTAAAMSRKRGYSAAGFEEIAQEAPKNLKDKLREHHGPDATLKCRCHMPLDACTRARMLASRGTWVLNCRMGLECGVVDEYEDRLRMDSDEHVRSEALADLRGM